MATDKELAEYNIHVFLEVYGIKNEQGIKLDFTEHSFLWDIYQDESPTIAVRKAAQVGFSTAAIIKSLWLAHNRKMDIIYTLPSYSDVHDFVTSKINRIIDQNQVFKDWTKDKDTIEQKQVGDSIIHYRGTWSERAALMISSDLNIHDEVDRSNLKVVDQYYSRLQHSKYHWQWLFSNPSVPEVGVDKLWNRSDQKHWFIKCSTCNKEQFLEMKNIFEKEKDQFYFGCTHCKTELDRNSGRWIARWKDIKDVSGYWISLLMCPWVSANRIKELERTKPADFFANFVLGIPYVGSGNVVAKNTIMQNLTNEINKQEGRIVIGVDTGVDIRYVIGNRQGIFYFGECKDYDELRKLMKRWPRAIMVCDGGGDIIAIRKFKEEFPNRIYLGWLRAERQTDELFQWDDNEMKVIIDRNNAVELLIGEFTDRRIPIYGTETDWFDYWLHWSHIYRTSKENAMGRQIYVWQRSDRDDWVMATVFWRAGMDRFFDGGGAIIDIQQSIGEVGYTTDPTGKHLFLPTRTY